MSNKQCSSDFFDHKVEKNKNLRATFAKMAMDDMIQFLYEDHAQQQIIKVESRENLEGGSGGIGGSGVEGAGGAGPARGAEPTRDEDQEPAEGGGLREGGLL